jgi:hypothetical protein
MDQHIAFTPAIRNLGWIDLKTRNTRQSLEVHPAESRFRRSQEMLLLRGINAGNLSDPPGYVTPTSGNISARAPFDGIGMPDHDHLCATFRIRNAEEIWEDRLQRIEIRDGETLRSYRQRLLDFVYLLGRIHQMSLLSASYSSEGCLVM